MQQYRAYKLCDDDKCSGKHDCQESGPTNSVNIYQCKEGTDTGVPLLALSNVMFA